MAASYPIAESFPSSGGESNNEQSHYVRLYIKRLREKLEDDPTKPAYIRTEKGIGYRLCGSHEKV
ncbi:winged helix-turn-helix domain-containing protein [Acidithiobacillus sulfuriphilus]|uniref:Winged helix-turn-helix domain-containing protein n=1 Tax=Acidithiobacillus sulfuriphilus TaxID=1867749 RepID=A0ACD5HR81_9PROT|nr:winged helix-turn-helix domain-containing protein [Acidithiobacillus sulfuriphilus]